MSLALTHLCLWGPSASFSPSSPRYFWLSKDAWAAAPESIFGISMNKERADAIVQAVVDGGNVTLSLAKDAVNPWKENYEGVGFVAIQISLCLLCLVTMAIARTGLRHEYALPAIKQNVRASLPLLTLF